MNHPDLLKILDLARWAPSGDNTQPWRFQILAANHIAVTGFDTRHEVLYDFNGWPSQMAHGALLETLRLAATRFGYRATWRLRPESPDASPIYDVFLEGNDEISPDPLADYIESRCVQRRPMRIRSLSDQDRRALSEAVGPGYTIKYFQSGSERWRIARILWKNAYIRLTCPEAFAVHQKIIEWGVDFSKDRLPERAIGVDRLTARLMRWVMVSWSRLQFFNRYLMGTLLPRVQLDFLPAIFCSAHLVLLPEKIPEGRLGFVEAGIAMQRLWLTCSARGLQLQPEMTPVIFRWYDQANARFSHLSELASLAGELAEQLAAACDIQPDDPLVFMCRVGDRRVTPSRSLRLDLSDLMHP